MEKMSKKLRYIWLVQFYKLNYMFEMSGSPKNI